MSSEPRIVERALGPDERGARWVDNAGVEWRSIGSPGEPYEGYGALWQHCPDGPWRYCTPTTDRGPYRELA